MDLFSMALIASIETVEGVKVSKLRKSCSVEVAHPDDFSKNEIDNALIKCIQETPELQKFDLIALVGDGSTAHDVIALHRVHLILNGKIQKTTIVVETPIEEQKEINQLFFQFLDDLNDYLAEHEDE